MEFRGYQGTYLSSLPPPDSTPLFTAHDSLYWLIAKCCAPDPADRFASADELRTQMLGVLRETVAAKNDGHRAHLGELGAVRGALGVHLGAVLVGAAEAAARRDRPAARLAEQHRSHRPRAAARRPAAGARGLRRGAAGAGAGAAGAGQPGKARETSAQLLAERPVGVARALDRRPRRHCSRATGTTRRRRSTRSTSRCPASSRPSWRSPSPARTAASPTSPRASTGPARVTDAAYVAPAAFGMARVRAATPGHRRAPSRRSTWCRPPAAATRRAASSAPTCCWPGRRSTWPCWTRRSTSIESVRMDPARAGALHDPDPHPGARAW